MTQEEKEDCKQNWRFRWLGLVFEFSHLEYQRGLWLEKRYPNAIGFFAEDICKYFDDLNLEDAYQYQVKQQIISIEEYESILEFHLAFEAYLNPSDQDIALHSYSDAEILSDVNWLNVVQLGEGAWTKLKTIIKAKPELDHMYGLEENYLT